MVDARDAVRAHAKSVPSGRIFISYRREEAVYPAGWLFDRLTEHFGEGSVFKDVNSIKFGDDFAAAIANAVDSCDVLLALIGQRWVTITDEHGHRRLDLPDDFVRREIEAALTKGVRVIPILLDRARMPKTDELPPSLIPLTGRQALSIDPDKFRTDTTQLIAELDKALDEDCSRTGATDGAARNRRRRMGIAFGSGVATVAAALVAWHFIPQPQSIIDLTEPGIYDDSVGDDNCYSGREELRASITLDGRPTRTTFVTCEYSRDSPSMQREYVFNIPSQYEGQEIVGLQGSFGVDEVDSLLGNLTHAGAVATWTVAQGERTLCSVRASWKSPGMCDIAEDFTLQSGRPLVIEETLQLEQGKAPEAYLWLGISEPQLVVRS